MHTETSEKFFFHRNATATSEGNELNIPISMTNITISISGTGSFRIYFEAYLFDEWMPISLFDTNVGDLKTNVDSFGLYQGDISGMLKVRCRLESVSGDITVVGNLVRSTISDNSDLTYKILVKYENSLNKPLWQYYEKISGTIYETESIEEAFVEIRHLLNLTPVPTVDIVASIPFYVYVSQKKKRRN